MGCSSSRKEENNLEPPDFLGENVEEEEIRQPSKYTTALAPQRLKQRVKLLDPKGNLNENGRLKSPEHNQRTPSKSYSWRPIRQRGSPQPQKHYQAPYKDPIATPAQLRVRPSLGDGPVQEANNLYKVLTLDPLPMRERDPRQEEVKDEWRGLNLSLENQDNLPWRPGYQSPTTRSSSMGYAPYSTRQNSQITNAQWEEKIAAAPPTPHEHPSPVHSAINHLQLWVRQINSADHSRTKDNGEAEHNAGGLSAQQIQDACALLTGIWGGVSTGPQCNGLTRWNNTRIEASPATGTEVTLKGSGISLWNQEQIGFQLSGLVDLASGLLNLTKTHFGKYNNSKNYEGLLQIVRSDTSGSSFLGIERIMDAASNELSTAHSAVGVSSYLMKFLESYDGGSRKEEGPKLQTYILYITGTYDQGVFQLSCRNEEAWGWRPGHRSPLELAVDRTLSSLAMIEEGEATLSPSSEECQSPQKRDSHWKSQRGSIASSIAGQNPNEGYVSIKEDTLKMLHKSSHDRKLMVHEKLAAGGEHRIQSQINVVGNR